MDQEQIMQIQLMEQEANQLNEHLKLIEQNINEIQDLRLSLDSIEKKESKEILANIGKRVYIPVEINEKKLIVDVGNNTYVKKSIPDTKLVIDDQIERLTGAKSDIMEKLEELQEKMQIILMNLEKEQAKNKKK